MKRVLKLVVALCAVLALVILLPIPAPKKQARLGFTHSILAAEYLGLDSDRVLEQALVDLRPDVVRIPVYWPIVEPQAGKFDFSAYDRQLELLEQHGSKAILAIGAKLPRWPECHLPHWLQPSDGRNSEHLNAYVQAVVDRYQSSDIVEAWQVENEALFPFGECPTWIRNFDALADEITFVRSLDSTRPVITTDSGELSLWWRSSRLPVDELGVSVYRAAYTMGRFVYWPVNAYFYRIKAALIRPFTNKIFVSELQLEPWGARPVHLLTDDEINASLAVADVAKRVDFAQRLGAETVLAWGVEWWYYMKEQGRGEYWQAAIEAFTK